MREKDKQAIRQLDIFSEAKEELFLSLTGPSFLQRFPAGVTLVHENTYADFLYVLIEGQVEMYAQSHGNETILDIVEPVGLFILAAVLNDDLCLQSARTLADSTVLMIPGSMVRNAMEEDMAFMRAVTRSLARSYRTTIKELKNQKLRDSSQRLANWILKRGQLHMEREYIDIPFEKRMLASFLGMTPENLSRAFTHLAQYGIKKDGARIIFTDRQKFIDYAKPDPLIDDPERE